MDHELTFLRQKNHEQKARIEEFKITVPDLRDQLTRELLNIGKIGIDNLWLT